MTFSCIHCSKASEFKSIPDAERNHWKDGGANVGRDLNERWAVCPSCNGRMKNDAAEAEEDGILEYLIKSKSK